MKKVLLVVFMVMFWASSAYSAYNNTAVCTASTVDNERTTYSCAFVDSVAGSATEEFRINADDKSGRLISARWKSASEDLDWWIAEEVDALVTDTDVVIFSATATNLGTGFTFSPTISYLNTSGEAYLYVTIKNDGAIATGTSAILILIYERP